MTATIELTKYLHDAKVLDLRERLTSQGYTVRTKHEEGGFNFDIVATNSSGKRLYVEVKSTPSDGKSIAEMFDYVKRHPNAEFRLVIATPPLNKTIEIDGLEEVLMDKLASSLPPELDRLSTHTNIEGISNIDINDIHIAGQRISVKGIASVEVELRYGSDGDNRKGDREIVYDSFPLEFSLIMDKDLRIEEVVSLYADTSSFYS